MDRHPAHTPSTSTAELPPPLQPIDIPLQPDCPNVLVQLVPTKSTHIICQYLYDLETKHSKICQPYEEDVHVVHDLDGML